jgi:2-oxoglutarate ferredoxin oxidoreductase subunit gamma
VTYLPSYGPEMRGGTCNCMVVVSDHEIASPVIYDSDVLVAMNQPSYDKFGPHVRAEGLIIANATLAESLYAPARGCRVVAAPFTGLAGELGDVRVCSMVALGRLVRETGIADADTVRAQMRALTAKRPELTALNESAFALGYSCAECVE